MARLITAGGEFGVKEPDGVFSMDAGWTIDTTKPRSGSYSYSATSGVLNFILTGALATTYYFRIYLWISALPIAESELFQIQDSGNNGIAHIKLEPSGGLRLLAGISTIIGSDSPVIALSDWNLIELSVKIGSSTNDDAVEGRLNGVSFASTTTANIGTLAPKQFAIFAVSTSWVDDIAINDSTGANQNSWPGSGKIVLLKPLSDNAKGTGWTDDQAATTNLFNDVDNTPPIGIADTTTGGGGHQLRNATSNANVNYDSNMQSYTAVGIGSSDTITVIDPVIITGAPVTTSAKAGTVGVVSNPTIANIALGAGGTAGAFWSGVAAGTYPTGWKLSHGTTTYNPAVTKGTQPVMRVTQVTASTRIAMVCAMGIYVEYIPASSLVVSKPGSAHSRFRRAAQSFDRW